MRSSKRFAVIAVLACAILGLGASSAAAATFTVNTTSDTFGGGCLATCSLREAVEAANLDATKDTIVLPAGTLRLERSGLDETNQAGDLDVYEPLVIRGTGAGTTTIHSTVQDRVLDVHGTDLSLADLTISGGQALTVANDDGGGIRDQGSGTLELEGVVVRENLAEGEASQAYGGGIAEFDGALVARDSAILANTARFGGYGGGIALVDSPATLSLTNVTIAQNHAQNIGGGIFFESETNAELAFTTVIENESTQEDGAFNGDPDLRTRSSIVARNMAPTGSDCSTGGAGASLGGNVGPVSCGFTLPTDSNAADPLLAPLSGTGIPVAEPLPGSPAIDRGLAPCPATDARGVARPQGAACDSGAAERPVAPAPASVAGAKISGVSVSRARFRAGAKVTRHVRRGETPVGTTIFFNLSAAATVKAEVLRLAPGRRAGSHCLAPTPARRGKHRCTRLVGAGSLPGRSFAAGRDELDFSGRLGGHDLAPGRYRVQLSAPGSTASTPVLRIVG